MDRLSDCGREYFDREYTMHFDNMFDSPSHRRFHHINQRLGQDCPRFTRYPIFTSWGAHRYQLEPWNDIRGVILLTPLKTLQWRNLFANPVPIETVNRFKFRPYSAISNYRRTNEEDGNRVEDEGAEDALLSGEGISATIELVNIKRNNFRVHAVNINVDTLKFAICGSNHSPLLQVPQTAADRFYQEADRQGALETERERKVLNASHLYSRSTPAFCSASVVSFAHPPGRSASLGRVAFVRGSDLEVRVRRSGSFGIRHVLALEGRGRGSDIAPIQLRTATFWLSRYSKPRINDFLPETDPESATSGHAEDS
ncbi:hypothetical protein D9619_008103 [Psilocybe cf. subviscida]|uniref:Uncharacterized protein n=1 Tax=Psilocybe cf. subviscida TaxID=2480587 RepID=A0A8H5AUF0_9AGAR|nr:hypothetical protein D9619_008103 [Psilocybe cf. subviscida]